MKPIVSALNYNSNNKESWTSWTNGPNKFQREQKTGRKRNKKGFCDIYFAPSFEQPTPQGPGLFSFCFSCCRYQALMGSRFEGALTLESASKKSETKMAFVI